MKRSQEFNLLETATEVLRAIAHPLRLSIIEMLHREKEMSVTRIFEELKVEQAIASHHLRIMKDKGVVGVRRDGKNSFYFLVDEGFFNIYTTLLQTQQGN